MPVFLTPIAVLQKHPLLEMLYSGGPPQPTTWESLVPMVFMFGALYVLFIRPNAQKAKDHEKLVTSLLPGDEVATTGGILGRVKGVAEDIVQLDVGGLVLRIEKEHIQRRVEASQGVGGKKPSTVKTSVKG